jgi:hypothetical protein
MARRQRNVAHSPRQARCEFVPLRAIGSLKLELKGKDRLLN